MQRNWMKHLGFLHVLCLEILHLSTEGISVLEVLGGGKLKLRVVARVTCGQVSATKRDPKKYPQSHIHNQKGVFQTLCFFWGGEGGWFV